MTKKKLSLSAKVDLIEERLYGGEAQLSTNERDRLYWLYENDIKFDYIVRYGEDIIIHIPDEINAMAYKLRWD